MNNRAFTGLDIGSSKVCAAVAVRTDPEALYAEVVGVGSIPCEGLQKGAVVDASAVVQAIEQAVDRAGREANCEVDSVYLGLSGAHIASLTSTGQIALTHREVSPTDVQRVIEASRVIVLPPERQIIHAFPLRYSVDGQPAGDNPIGMRGQRLEVETHIIHGSAHALHAVEKCVTDAGLDLDQSVLETVAAAELILLPTEKESGVCLLDIGGSTSNLAVFVSSVLFHTAVIPIGGNHVTNDIAYGLTVGRAEAERLKIQDGHALIDQTPADDVVSVRQLGNEVARKLRRRALVQIIEPRMQELAQFATDELSLADCKDKIGSGIVLAGRGSLLNGCMELFNEATGLPVRLGGASHQPGGRLIEPEHAVAAGLAIYGAARQAAAERQRDHSDQTPFKAAWSQLMQSIRRSVPTR